MHTYTHMHAHRHKHTHTNTHTYTRKHTNIQQWHHQCGSFFWCLVFVCKSFGFRVYGFEFQVKKCEVLGYKDKVYSLGLKFQGSGFMV